MKPFGKKAKPRPRGQTAMECREQRRDQMKNINKSQLLLNIGRKENIIGSRDFLSMAENIFQNYR